VFYRRKKMKLEPLAYALIKYALNHLINQRQERIIDLSSQKQRTAGEDMELNDCLKAVEIYTIDMNHYDYLLKTDDGKKLDA
jgi:hypothetical protein|tara:strand:- start:111 stop:356 length:246 start_codon:yes stop_codon:yes gene_type:complete